MGVDSTDASDHRGAVARVEDFLVDVGLGRYDAAERRLAANVVMVFPGDRVFSSLKDVGVFAAERYRSIDKRRETYDVFATDEGEDIVYSLGTLFGENRWGVTFANVRYVDRFCLRGGRIVEQRVWNDLTETGVLEARCPQDLPDRYRDTK